MAAQDLPPRGGFGNISVAKTYAKPLMRGGIYFLALIAMSANGLVTLREKRLRNKTLKAESYEHVIATIPFLLAEQERLFLRRLRDLRDDEKALMKDVPNWKVGTLYGEPIFKTLPKDVLPPICSQEFASHRPNREWRKLILPDEIVF